MATLKAIYDLMTPQNPVLGRVMGALFKGAWAVLVADDPAPSANSLALAHKIIKDPGSLHPTAWRLFLSNSTVQAQLDDLDGGLTDSDIEYVMITEQWDTLAELEA